MVQASPSSTSPADRMRLSTRHARYLVVEEVICQGKIRSSGSSPSPERNASISSA